MARAVPDANTIMTMINSPENYKLTHLAILAVENPPIILLHFRLPETYQTMSSMRHETWFELCVRDIEFLGQVLDAAGARVTASFGQDICRGMIKSRTSPQHFGLHQRNSMRHIANPAMPVEILQDSAPFISPNYVRHTRGCDEDSAQLIPLADQTHCIR